MRFVAMNGFGGPEVLNLQETQKPVIGEGDVLIQVHAAGVNRPDCAQRLGTYPPPPGVSNILGLEVAGEIVECGSQVQRWQKGDRVCALVAGGGYAEYVAAPEGQCLPVPSGMDMLHAAAIPETFFTVWTNVFESGGLKSGESILIHGGSGGIGTTAIQLAHAWGARVFTTVGKTESKESCLKIGADCAILYKEEDFVEVIKKETQGQGVHLVLDMVGGDYFIRNLECLAPRGRLVQIATLKGAHVQLDLRKMMQKRLTLTGSTLRARSVAEKTTIAQALEKNVWPLLNSGRVKPLLDKVFTLDQAREAHEHMESSAHTGKIVLKVK